MITVAATSDSELPHAGSPAPVWTLQQFQEVTPYSAEDRYDDRVAFSTKNLHGDEEIVLDLHPHWVVYIKGVLALVVATAVGIFLLTRSIDGVFGRIVNSIAIILIIVALLYLVQRLIAWKTTNFVVTTDRCIYREGILSKRGIEIPLERINTVFFHQGMIDRVFGAGTLTIESAGENGTQNFEDIKDPIGVQQVLYQQIEANERDKFSGIVQDGPSVADELTKLAELRAQGVISEEEFQDQKSRLLD